MKRSHAAWWLVCLSFFYGCPGAKPPGDSGVENFDSPATTDISGGGKVNPHEDGAPSGISSSAPKDEVASAQKSLSLTDREALSVLTKEHFAAVKLNVEKLRRSPLVEKLPGGFDDMIERFIQEQSPLDFSEHAADLEMLLAAASPGTGRFGGFMMQERIVGDDDPALELNAPDAATEPPIHATIYAQFKTEKAIAQLRTLYAQEDDARRVKYGEGEYFQGLHVPIYFFFGRRHVVIASQESLIRTAIDHAGEPADSPLIQRLHEIDLNADFVAAGVLGPVRDSLGELIEGAEGVRPQVTVVVEKLNAFSLAIDLEAKEIIDLQADAVNEDGAQMLHDTVKGLLALANFGLAGQMKRAGDSDASPEALKIMKFAQRTLGQVLAQRDGTRLDVSLARPHDLDEVVEKVVISTVGSAK